MAAVAPLPRRAPDDGLRVRAGDLRRAPLQRRPMPRSTAGAHVVTTVRPHLEIVPRRRKAMGFVMIGALLLFAMLIGAVAFQTQIARNQLALDKTERAVSTARDRYDVLRRQRAELRSPNRLAVEAQRLGMSPAQSGEFMTVTPDVVASVLASASSLTTAAGEHGATSLEQFGEVKAVTGDVP